MNPDLQTWLETARANLTPKARVRVRQQILEHYNTALEAYQKSGTPLKAAQALALADLGNAEETRKKFEQVYLTQKDLYNLEYSKNHSKHTALLVLGIATVIVTGLCYWFFLQYLDSPKNTFGYNVLFTAVLSLSLLSRYFLANYGSLTEFARYNLFITPLFFLTLAFSPFAMPALTADIDIYDPILRVLQSIMAFGTGLVIFVSGQATFGFSSLRKLRSF